MSVFILGGPTPRGFEHEPSTYIRAVRNGFFEKKLKNLFGTVFWGLQSLGWGRSVHCGVVEKVAKTIIFNLDFQTGEDRLLVRGLDNEQLA